MVVAPSVDPAAAGSGISRGRGHDGVPRRRADGQASEAEHDALLDRLEILGGVDRDQIDEQLMAVSRDLDASGFEPRIARVAELVGDQEGADAALMLGVAIALADDDFSKDEREVTGQLAAALGCTVDLDQLAAEIRG